MAILLLVIGILLFISLIIVHEYGHFIMARRNGVEVEEFGIFFPPRLYKRKMRGGWDFTINALPLGGFVRLKGESDSDTKPGTFGAASLWVKSKIMAAGVVMNLITALALFTIIALIGMPNLIQDNQFTVKSDTKVISHQTLTGYIEPDSPAAKAGLQSSDKLQSIGLPGQKPTAIDNAKSLQPLTKKFAGKTAVMFYERSGQLRETKVKLRTVAEVAASLKAGNPKGHLGIMPRDYNLQRSTWSAPVVAVGVSAQLTSMTFEALGRALDGLGGIIAGAVTGNGDARREGQTKASQDVGGPVAIYVILRDGSLIGYQFMLFVIAYISLTLAIMNILPIPALDGGRLWLTLFARGILKRPLSEKLEGNLIAGGMIVLLSLMVLITIVDVKRFF